MSLRMIYGADEMVARWVAAQTHQADFGTAPAAIACGDGQQILCGVVYHSFRKFDIFMSIAATNARWATRSVIGKFLEYPYVQLGCLRTTVVVAKSNKRSRKLVEGVGWRQEGSLRQGFDGTENAIVYGMLRSEAQRWLEYAPRMTNVVMLNKNGDSNVRWEGRGLAAAAA